MPTVPDDKDSEALLRTRLFLFAQLSLNCLGHREALKSSTAGCAHCIPRRLRLSIRPGSRAMLPLDPHALKIYIDGSALQNPGGAGGLAGIVVYPDDWNLPNERIFEIGYQATTNNRMELLACLKAFEWVRENAIALRVQRVQIITDSTYVYEGRDHATWWRQNGWRNASGKPVDNPDLWKEFLSARSKLRVRTDIVLTKGKASPVLRDVDRSAKSAAEQPWEIDRGFRSGKVGKSKLGGKGASTLFPAAGQEAVIHIYRSGVTGRDGYHVRFNLYSEQEKRFVAKHLTYTSAGLSAELHRHHCYRVRFNSDPKHPVIEVILEEVTDPTKLTLTEQKHEFPKS